MEEKPIIPKMFPQINVKYQILKKQGILYTHKGIQILCAPPLKAFFRRPLTQPPGRNVFWAKQFSARFSLFTLVHCYDVRVVMHVAIMYSDSLSHMTSSNRSVQFSVTFT